jgi:hypothetical protein
LLTFSLPAAADSIIFKDGMHIETSDIWEENEEVKCEIGGIVFGYPKSDVARIERGGGKAGRAATDVLEVHKQVTVVPEKETAGPAKKPAFSGQKSAALKKKPLVSKKGTSAPEKQAKASKREPVIPEKKSSATGEKRVVAQKATSDPTDKAVVAKETQVTKKKRPPKATAPRYAGIPSFKEIINEDDNNPPVYIKRRRVLLVPRGLTKAQIRALLLSYEKKLRNELNNRKAEYKLIVVWVYDDFERADEGAAGWVGKISNQQKSGKLSDNPELVIR